MPTLELLLDDKTLAGLLMLSAFFIGLSKGGLPAVGMLSVPMLSVSMSPLVAAVLLLPIYLVSDVVGVWLYRREYSRENLLILLPAGVVGVVLGWATASFVSDRMVALLIGIMGIIFCLHTWLKKADDAPPSPVNKLQGACWGTLSGFTSFVSHAGAPPFQIYILPQKLPKMVFAGTTTIVFAAVNLAKIVPYSALHPYTRETIEVSIFLLPIAIVGTYVGKRLIKKLPEQWFYRVVQIALFIISIRLVLSVIGAE